MSVVRSGARPRAVSLRLLAGLAIAAALLLAFARTAGATDLSDRPFSATGVWNTPTPSNAPLDPNSGNLVNELTRQVNSAGPWINTTSYSTPVIRVPDGTPTQKVYLDTPSSMYTNATDAAALQSQLNAVPIPSNAVHAPGLDAHVVFWQKSTDTMWELWNVHVVPYEIDPWGRTEPGWHAAWGAKITNVSQNPGIVQAPFGATASGLPLMGGLMTISELQQGSIDHALAMAIPQPQAGRFVYPANRTDGNYSGANAIPEGTKFRIDPKVNLNTIAMPPMTRMMAVAAQKYGIYVRDTASNVAFFAEESTAWSLPSPYTATGGLFGALSPSQLLGSFPWSKLQVVTPGG